MDVEATPPPPRATDFVTTWRQVTEDPAGFFATMPPTGGLAEPMRFLALVAALDAAGSFVVCWSPWRAAAVFVGLLVGVVLVAAVATLVAQNLFDGAAGFEPMLRATAYGSAPGVLYGIPLLGALACAYAWYLQVRGIERVQGLDATKAAVTALAAWGAVWLFARGLPAPPVGW
jgi:hypothetical protein